MTAIILILILFLFLLASIPIFVSIGLATLLVLYFAVDAPSMIVIQRFFSGIDKFALMAMPFFIFAAYVMDIGGLSDRILRWSKLVVGHVAGGLAMTTQVASMFFGALSGSSRATVAAIGKSMYPELLKSGYDRSFASGLITASGSVALIIPPSLSMIIYASVVGASVGELFIAGIGAGLCYGLAYIAYIYYYAKKHNLPRGERAPFREVWEETKRASWSLAVPVIILGGIYFGVFTPTEAAGVAVVYGMFVGAFINKQITPKKLFEAAIDSAVMSAQVLILVAAASALAWLLTTLQVPQAMSAILLDNVTSGWMLILLLNILLIIAGMFIDGVTAIIIIAPLIFTAAMSFGINPVHLGIIMVTNLTIGMFTPPFGLNIFVSQGITNLSVVELLPGLMRFLIISIIALLLISYVPAISMFLPNLIYR